MAYFSLAHGAGYFKSQTALDSTLKTEAELYADTRVNTAFAPWNRTAWTGGAIPIEIKQAAEMLGAGKYLEKVFATGNPAVKENSLAQTLLKGGEELMKTTIDAGGPTDPANPDYRLYPVREVQSSRHIRVVPG